MDGLGSQRDLQMCRHQLDPPHSLDSPPRSLYWLQCPLQSGEHLTVCPPMPTATAMARFPNHGFNLPDCNSPHRVTWPGQPSLLIPGGPCDPPAGLLCRRSNGRWEFSILKMKFSEFGCASSLTLDHHILFRNRISVWPSSEAVGPGSGVHCTPRHI